MTIARFIVPLLCFAGGVFFIGTSTTSGGILFGFILVVINSFIITTIILMKYRS